MRSDIIFKCPIISEYVPSVQRMDDMGRDMEKSNLYLKLFKLVFGSVTLFAQENELMLKVSPKPPGKFVIFTLT